MRVAVMGSGGLGGYFGGLLAKGGADVSFVARGAHLDATRGDVLHIEGGPDPFHHEDVRATDDPTEIGPVDLVMLCVKRWDTEAARRSRYGAGVVSERGAEGLDAAGGYDESQLIGGVAYVATTVSQPGVISRMGPLRRLIVGEFDGRRSARVEAFHAAARAGGVDGEISDDIRRAIWEKFVFLVGLSATTTTMRVPIGPIPENPPSRTLLLDLMREVVAVGRAQHPVYPRQRAARVGEAVRRAASPPQRRSTKQAGSRGVAGEVGLGLERIAVTVDLDRKYAQRGRGSERSKGRGVAVTGPSA